MIKLDPKNILAFYNKGKAYHNLKRYSDAISCYETAIKLDPQFFDAYIGLGEYIIIHY